MRELLLKNKKGFAKYLFATFLFIIDHFVQIGFCALLMGAMEKGDVAYYNQFLFVVVAVAVYSPISFIVSRLLRIGYMRDTILTVRKQAFGKLMRMPFKKFSRQSKETYLSNLVNDINDFENRFFVSLLNFLINVGMFVLTFVVLCFVDWIWSLKNAKRGLICSSWRTGRTFPEVRDRELQLRELSQRRQRFSLLMREPQHLMWSLAVK